MNPAVVGGLKIVGSVWRVKLKEPWYCRCRCFGLHAVVVLSRGGWHSTTTAMSHTTANNDHTVQPEAKDGYIYSHEARSQRRVDVRRARASSEQLTVIGFVWPACAVQPPHQWPYIDPVSALCRYSTTPDLKHRQQPPNGPKEEELPVWVC